MKFGDENKYDVNFSDSSQTNKFEMLSLVTVGGASASARVCKQIIIIY